MFSAPSLFATNIHNKTLASVIQLSKSKLIKVIITPEMEQNYDLQRQKREAQFNVELIFDTTC